MSEGDAVVSQSTGSTGAWESFDSTGPAWSVGLARTDTKDALVAGCASGELRVWSFKDRDYAERTATGHAGSVLAVALGRVDGLDVVVTGGVDGRLRVWSLEGGDEPIAALSGHVGAIRSLAFGHTAKVPIVASAGADATIQIWDLRALMSLTTIPKAHAGSALAVVLADLDGKPLLISGGDDAQIRRWSPETGEAVGPPLVRHRGAIRSLACGTVDGQPLLASASDDGSVQLWDLREGSPLYSPLIGHAGVVRSVAFMRFGSTDVVVSGGIDGAIRFWDPRTGSPFPARLVLPDSDIRSVAVGTGIDPRIAIGGSAGVRSARLRDLIDADRVFASGIDRSMVVSADQVEASDVLGRRILARHLRGVIEQFLAPLDEAVLPRSSVVISVDGRWGAGKTTLVRLLEEDLQGDRRDSADSRSTGPRVPVAPLLTQPVMVHFDAWRESAIAPHWWAMMSGLNREIRRSRSLPARVWMSITGFVRTVLRSPTTLAAVLITIGLAAGVVSLRSAAPSEVANVLEAIQILITVVTALFATVAVATRSLVWSSPALGRFHVRADDNPLGEVADMVMQLRRWSPRARSSPALETICTAALLISIGVGVRVALVAPGVLQFSGFSRRYLIGLATGLLLSVLLWLSTPSLASTRNKAPDTGGRSNSTALSATSALGVWRFFAVASGAAAAYLISVLDVPNDVGGGRIALGLCGAGAMLSVLLLIYYRQSPRFGERRPVVLVIDELDRCPAPIVVAYLETVHTLLRDPTSRTRRRRRSWQQPAPLVVLALADGRWVRTAFTTEFSDYRDLGSSVRSLGGDFLQKLFDHTVLVPELNVDQVKQMVGEATSRRTFEGSGVAPGSLAPAVISQGAARLQALPLRPDPEPESAQTEDSQTTGDGSPDASSTIAVEQREAVEAAGAAVRPAAIRAREAHLLSTYAALLPANPRLIRRVVNTWGMLEAIKNHTRHEASDQVMVRAAIAYVTFPSLVDQLLSSPWPPSLPSHVSALPSSRDDTWLRPDVIGLLVRENGSLVSPAEIAECFGKKYADDQRLVTTASPQPTEEGKAPTGLTPVPDAEARNLVESDRSRDSAIRQPRTPPSTRSLRDLARGIWPGRSQPKQ